MTRKFLIGTRGSALATWQARHVKDLIEKYSQPVSCELRIIKTKGDGITDLPLSRIGTKGLFTKEIEEALSRGEIDCAVHSMKDLPTELPGGLSIGAVLEREHPGDAFVSNEFKSLSEVEGGTEIGTSSLRRRAQLLALNPDFRIVDLRGNIDTRLKKIADGNPPAAVLAVAGLKRLGFENRISEILGIEIMIPAVAQGAIAVEIREGDSRAGEILAPLHSAETAACCDAERALLKTLEGGCQIPVGAHARVSEGKLDLVGVVADLDGKKIIRDRLHGTVATARKCGINLANRLLAAGADEILKKIRDAQWE